MNTLGAQKNDKTFIVSDKVEVENVRYKNRFGITIAADMYVPIDFDKSEKYPAIVIGTPYGGVKEQGAGIYAMVLAERGFITLAFDESYNGESSGEPRIFLLRIFLSRILVLRSILSVHDHLLTEIVSARSDFAGVEALLLRRPR